MPITQVNQIQAHRLREELQALGMDHRGPRGELVSRLVQAGVYEVNTDFPPKPLKIDRTSRFPNHTSVLLGAGAILEENDDNQLIISNDKKEPLIHGDFQTQITSFNNCINLKNSIVTADTLGQEGDIRQNEGELYMYRKTNVHEGWYALRFDSLLMF